MFGSNNFSHFFASSSSNKPSTEKYPFKISHVQKESVYYKMGLRNGDTVVEMFEGKHGTKKVVEFKIIRNNKKYLLFFIESRTTILRPVKQF